MNTIPSHEDEQQGFDLSGRELGDYRLLRRLGRGGMAEVYLAEQLSLRRQVAFKILRRNLASEPKYVKRFHVEAQAVAALVHANIVQIYEVGEIEGNHYIAQEYVQGPNLREYLVKHGTLGFKTALRIMRQVAAALHRAGERGIVHRDIKPENILLTYDGDVKVADFGLARVVREGTPTNLTQIGVAMGTPLYMSPEQVEGKPIDHRSDIYSLGVTCYHMLAGIPPFRGETALSVAVQHIKNDPERLETVRPDLPANMCRVVHKMLAKEPSHRFASALDLLRDLKALGGDADDGMPDLELTETLRKDAKERLRSTERLNAVMQTMALQMRDRRRGLYRIVGGVVAILLAIAIGASVSFATRESDLLTVNPEDSLGIPRMDSASAQYYRAVFSRKDDPRPWQAVLEYHGGSDFDDRAKRELARVYLQNDKLDDAMVIFDEFSQRSEDVNQFDRAVGLAGKYVVYTFDGERDKAQQTWVKFAEIPQDVFNPFDTRENPSVRWLKVFFIRAVQINNDDMAEEELGNLLNEKTVDTSPGGQV
ncbi:MAG: protein kinase [Pirellulales bacterium]|nr:protein kinase [Pirellulales bacterium]